MIRYDKASPGLSSYLALLDDLKLPAFLVEGDGPVVALNREAERFTGYSFEEVRGKSWLDFLVSMEDVEKAKQYLKVCLNASAPSGLRCIVRVRDRRGKIKEVALCASSPAGERKFILVMQDVTAARKAYRLLRLLTKAHGKKVSGVRNRSKLLERFAEILQKEGYSELPIRKEGKVSGFEDVLRSSAFRGEDAKTLKQFSRILNHGLQTLRYREALEEALQEAIEAISHLVEVRDPYTSGHQRRVAGIACAVAKKMGLSEELIEKIRVAGLLHDVGKIGIPIDILNKPVPLSPLEFEMIKTHPTLGYQILSKIRYLGKVAEIIFQHHERLDGSGYPRGLKGEEILLEARIIAVADVAEAMSSHRAYRALLPREEIVAELLKNRGKLYDPAVVDAFLEVIEEIPQILCLEMRELD